MPGTRIERVDDLPLILTWLLNMHVSVIINGIWHSHGRWQGLSYGQLALLFVAYIIHQRSHRLMKMEGWLNDHRTVIEQVTGWSICQKEATDDRIGLLLDELGYSEEKCATLQQRLGEHLIQAYELPTDVGRYDTSSFSVHHAVPEPGEPPRELLRFGHSKDKQPSLLQFKQGLGTLDPAGVPILTHTLSGEVADDGLYLSAWQQMGVTLKRTDFLLVADCKAAAMETRVGIATQQGFYLFPLPMTGETPAWLQEQDQASHHPRDCSARSGRQLRSTQGAGQRLCGRTHHEPHSSRPEHLHLGRTMVCHPQSKSGRSPASQFAKTIRAHRGRIAAFAS